MRARATTQIALSCFLLACRTAPPAGDSARDASNSAIDTTGTASSGATTSVSTPESPSRTASAADSALSAAVHVLRDYYSALNARDYQRAYAAWGPNGPPGQPSRAAFAAGYVATDSIRLTIGTPGPLEGAAGSRYLTVPVTMLAFERRGQTTYSGTYTLRRTVVSGASDAARRWHLYRARVARRQPD